MEKFEYYFNMSMTILGCFFSIGIVGYALISFTAWLDAKSISKRIEMQKKQDELSRKKSELIQSIKSIQSIRNKRQEK